MSVTFVDSNVLIAAGIASDANHETAREILTGIDGGALPRTRLSNYVTAELLNYMHARGGHSAGMEFYDRLAIAEGFEVVHATRQDYHGTLSLFDRRPTLSFVDATIISYMRREGITYLYSFDDDFDAFEGIERLNVPENPYA
ncbi:MAG TPA: PIN domain-containing protein [Halobacteriales archaeon]|nr:PIN domain-containing protein [Halobacteriales archaeon]